MELSLPFLILLLWGKRPVITISCLEKKHAILPMYFVKLRISFLNFIHIPFQNDDLSSHSSEVKLRLNSSATSILLLFPFECFFSSFSPSHSFRVWLSISRYLNVKDIIIEYYNRLPFTHLSVHFEMKNAEVWIWWFCMEQIGGYTGTWCHMSYPYKINIQGRLSQECSFIYKPW